MMFLGGRGAGDGGGLFWGRGILFLLSGEDSGRETVLTETVREALALRTGTGIGGNDVGDVRLMGAVGHPDARTARWGQGSGRQE